MAFAQGLRAAREAAGLSQQQLAAQMTGAGYRMRQTTISKIEAGTRPVWLGEATALAAAVGASLAYLAAGPSDPGELATALGTRAGAIQRRNQAAARFAGIREELDRAAAEVKDAEDAVNDADLLVNALRRRNGEVTA